jgi:adenylate cyclase
MGKTRKIAWGLGLGAGAAALALLLWSSGLLDRWEYTAWAWRVALFARPGAATPKVKVILLDQASLDWGKEANGWSWPWPREVYGPLIDFCRRGGARAIMFDVLYTEPSLYGVADDQALAAAIQRAPAFVAPLCLGEQSGSAASWPPEIPCRPIHINTLPLRMAALKENSTFASRCAFPVPEVANSATLLANVMDEPDEDGIFRRAHLFRVFDGHAIPSLGLAAYIVGNDGASRDAALPFPATITTDGGSPLASSTLPPARAAGPRVAGEGVEALLRSAHIEQGWLTVGNKRVPVDVSQRAILRFRGPSGTHQTFSAAAVIQSELRMQAGEAPTIQDPEVFRDAYVFFGFSAPGLMDLRPTPLSRVYPGVEIHATMLDNLLSDDFLREAPQSLVVLAVAFFACLSGLAVLYSRKAWHGALAFSGFLPVPVVAGVLAYRLGYWWPMVVQESAVVFSMVSALVVNYATEGRQKAFIKQAFKYYLSPEVIERILDDPSRLQLGGERRELTIFFSDLHKFSSISERLDAHTLTSLLNDYLSDMTDIILEEGGTLDKYEGDAIIAFWSAPCEQPDHALRACRTALRCQQKLHERANEFRERAGSPLLMRIGINTGDVVVGNMGSHTRFDYTVLGDAANLASRLEGANKAFGTSIMVSEATWEQTSGHLPGREIGLLRVVGRKAPVRVFELAQHHGPTDGLPAELFHQGIARCYAGQWAEALQIFERFADDSVAEVYAERCRILLRDPSASWDGIWNLTEK